MKTETKTSEGIKASEIDALSGTVSRVGHSDLILQWRYDQWRQMGAKHARATFLADTRIDLGQARAMFKQGCSLDLIEEILLGTCFAGEDELWYRDEPVAAAVEYEDNDDGA